jgi:putative hydrolase of the HAD superfamily
VSLSDHDHDRSEPTDRVKGFALFDLDNTLIDRQAFFRRWAESFASNRALGPAAVQVLCEADADGFATREAVFETARQRLSLDDPIEDLIAQYRKDYPTFFRPDPAVLDALQRLRSGAFRIGVVTNGPASQTDKLERTGLFPLVDGVCISDEYGIGKPDPRIFAEAVRRCGCESFAARDRWMVGDSPRADIAGGQGFGLRTIWISRGREWDEVGFAPDLIAPDAAGAIEMILDSSADLE